ncbi:MAG TPA: class I SAM-dependent methyltransferase [Vicinamibacterales bacterium]|nr:class I SAM-dependent methyltransferase [Vicinamibacterales bacterium]
MVRAALVKVFDRVRERFLVGVAREERVDQRFDSLYDQVAGLMQIHSALSGGPVLKPLRQWALSPDAIALILADLQERSRPSVVEFGCGQSTVVFASWIKQRGGRLTTYEHDPHYAEVIRAQLDACGLSAHVDLRVVSLIDHPAVGPLPASKSYDLPADRDGFDVALVDGPPYWTGEAGRYHPLKWSVDRLNAGGSAYLDDAARPPEQRIVAHLKTAVPGLTAAELRAEKGLVKITK